MENPKAMASDPFGIENVPPLMVEYRKQDRQRKSRMYEVGPLRLTDFMAMLRPDGYARFRRLDSMQVTRTSHMKSDNKTCEEAFNDIWRHLKKP